jgi:aldehyde dehydrogenase (NAD+)
MKDLLKRLELSELNSGVSGVKQSGQHILKSYSPIDGSLIASVHVADDHDYENTVALARSTSLEWKKVPAPERGQLVRKLGNAIRDHKLDLGKLITLEMGKILSEGEGEVQEAIDMADFAVGLSRQLYGKTMHSERPRHRMYEQWHPLGVVGVITAFNFPAAVWAWNAMLAAVCGNVVLWKPSEITPLVSVALNRIAARVAEQEGFPGLFTLLVGDGPAIGKKMASDPRFPLISATGSTEMGRSVGQAVASRLGKVILELGGNNAIIITEDADLEMAMRAVVFGAVGTAGQRCTTTRRIIIDKKIEAQFIENLKRVYSSIKIGNPLESEVLMGPLVRKFSVDEFQKALEEIKKQGGELVYGGEKLTNMPSDLYVRPAIVRCAASLPVMQQETFAPILYVVGVSDLLEAVKVHNDVPQGLSSAIFTTDLRKAEHFLSYEGSDCGIANVNIGTSGAEIGGAFGGEKETGGGREAGSDSWQQYMRRQTSTINYGSEMPLAQGVKFNIAP